MQSEAKQPKFDVIDSSRKVATGRNLREQLRNIVCLLAVASKGGVEDTRLEAEAKYTKNIRGQGQGQPFRGQTLSRPRTGMLEAKAKDQARTQVQVLPPPQKRSSQQFFW